MLGSRREQSARLRVSFPGKVLGVACGDYEVHGKCLELNVRVCWVRTQSWHLPSNIY